MPANVHRESREIWLRSQQPGPEPMAHHYRRPAVLTRLVVGEAAAEDGRHAHDREEAAGDGVDTGDHGLASACDGAAATAPSGHHGEAHRASPPVLEVRV